MTASTPDPAAGVAPVRRRVSPQAGEPGPVARVTGPGGKSSPPALPPPPEGAPSSSLPSERQAARIPSPVTGAPSPSLGGAPGRGRAPRTPAEGVGASPVPSAGSTGRTFTIPLPAGMKLLSLNDRLHFGERHRRTQDLKRAACVLALNAKVPRLERVSVVVEYQPRDRRHRDADNIAASAKALIDGLRAGKILPEDDSRHVTEVTCRIGEPYPLGRLVLHLTEVTA